MPQRLFGSVLLLDVKLLFADGAERVILGVIVQVGDSFTQFRFAEEKEWDGEASCPKQATVPLELPQVKPKRSDDSKGLGMHLKGPLGLGGRGPLSELRSSAGCPGSLTNDSPGPDPSGGSQKPTSLPQSGADHLEEELDLLLNLDAPVKEGDNILPDQTSQDLKSERDGQVAQEEEVPAKPSVTEEKNVESEQPSTSKNVTEEELEDWLDSMIS
ncbi:Cell death regulator Aven [Sciurus carolinensis]|uniref:Cell death regulator Aven n=1 Tax=Sciurus carolinensis TaxID=30640 RepID=A0AA41MUX9_SCICA|nr:Cell death regulator Aven [Sciurus carolinensis]